MVGNCIWAYVGLGLAGRLGIGLGMGLGLAGRLGSVYLGLGLIFGYFWTILGSIFELSLLTS